MTIYTKEDYNNEPVHYCDNCKSLNVKELKNSSLVTCIECGNTHIIEDTLDNWNEIYIKEYGQSFLSEERLQVEED